MSRFFVGQRVKKVRGEALGTVGRITSFSPDYPGCDVVIRLGDSVVNSRGQQFDPGEAADCYLKHWEPILPEGGGACDDEFKRDLEKLLEGVSA